MSTTNSVYYLCQGGIVSATVCLCLLVCVDTIIVSSLALRFPGHQISWVSEYAVFLTNGGHERNKIEHKGSLGDEDDARTSNTRIAHLMMKNNCNILGWCNNIHQGVLRTGKQTCACTSDLGDGSHVTCYDKVSVIYGLC